MSNTLSTGNDVVDAVGRINFAGNIVPMNWLKTIVKENGKPDLVAILLLSDIVYWYRPTEVRDELSGATIRKQKKFAADCLQRSYGQIESLMGLTKEQSKAAIQRLENVGVIRREFRTINTNTARLNNVMFIHLFPDVLESLTYESTPPRIFPHRGAAISPQVCGSSREASEEKDAHKYKDSVLKDYSETNPQTNCACIGKSNVGWNGGLDYSGAFIAAWEQVPPSKRSTKGKELAWKAWREAVATQGVSETTIAAGYKTYVSQQMNAGIEERYLATLTNWLDPNKDTAGYSLAEAVEKQAKKEERKQRELARRKAEAEKEARQREEEKREQQWLESDPVAMELRQRAFSGTHGTDFKRMHDDIQAFFEYRKNNFATA